MTHRQKKSLLRNRSMRAGETEEVDVMRKMKAKVQLDAQNSWWVSAVLAVDCKKGVGSPKMGGHTAAVVQIAVGRRRRMRKRAKKKTRSRSAV